ncbi:unnamed protein product [Spirodela intermedia]|uniref:Uncharacterized protein n=1 Tax=Spirodela intermedia TaxID=51605 RepID=A0A7I8L1L4_SPIIN|nr:unnamed protein product [Spirodela intermedia]
MVGPSTPIGTIRHIQGLTRFSRGHLPFEYLECPIFLGHRRIHYFDALVGKLRKKLAGWKLQLLSLGGRIQLIRHVLMSMPLHLLAVHEWKLNVDEASQGNPGPSGGGGILHDSTGCILFAFSNFYNIRTNTEAEAMTQEYLGRHHAMSKTHHNHYASVPRRESDSQCPCYVWSQIASEDSLLFLTGHAPRSSSSFSPNADQPVSLNMMSELESISSIITSPLKKEVFHPPCHPRPFVSPPPSSSPPIHSSPHSKSPSPLSPHRPRQTLRLPT